MEIRLIETSPESIFSSEGGFRVVKAPSAVPFDAEGYTSIPPSSLTAESHNGRKRSMLVATFSKPFDQPPSSREKCNTKFELCIGRDPAVAHVVVPFKLENGPLLSRKHFGVRISFDQLHSTVDTVAFAVECVDYRSLNGTFVNNCRCGPITWTTGFTHKMSGKSLFSLQLGAGSRIGVGEALPESSVRLRFDVIVSLLEGAHQENIVTNLLGCQLPRTELVDSDISFLQNVVEQPQYARDSDLLQPGAPALPPFPIEAIPVQKDQTQAPIDGHDSTTTVTSTVKPQLSLVALYSASISDLSTSKHALAADVLSSILREHGYGDAGPAVAAAVPNEISCVGLEVDDPVGEACAVPLVGLECAPPAPVPVDKEVDPPTHSEKTEGSVVLAHNSMLSQRGSDICSLRHVVPLLRPLGGDEMLLRVVELDDPSHELSQPPLSLTDAHDEVVPLLPKRKETNANGKSRKRPRCTDLGNVTELCAALAAENNKVASEAAAALRAGLQFVKSEPDLEQRVNRSETTASIVPKEPEALASQSSDDALLGDLLFPRRGPPASPTPSSQQLQDVAEVEEKGFVKKSPSVETLRCLFDDSISNEGLESAAVLSQEFVLIPSQFALSSTSMVEVDNDGLVNSSSLVAEDFSQFDVTSCRRRHTGKSTGVSGEEKVSKPKSKHVHFAEDIGATNDESFSDDAVRSIALQFSKPASKVSSTVSRRKRLESVLDAIAQPGHDRATPSRIAQPPSRVVRRSPSMLELERAPTLNGRILFDSGSFVITVPDHIMEVLKPHQLEGVHFLWNRLMYLSSPSDGGQQDRRCTSLAKKVPTSTSTTRTPQESHGEFVPLEGVAPTLEMETPLLPSNGTRAFRGAVLAHAMGLGKSLTALSFLFILWRFFSNQRYTPSVSSFPWLQQLMGTGLRAVLAVPKPIVFQWVREIQRWLESLHEEPVMVFVVSGDSRTDIVTLVTEWAQACGRRERCILMITHSMLASIMNVDAQASPTTAGGMPSLPCEVAQDGLDEGEDDDPESALPSDSVAKTIRLQKYRSCRQVLLEQCNLLIVDEAHRFQRRGSRLFHAANAFNQTAEGRQEVMRVALTGTPLVSSGGEELLTLLGFVLPSLWSKKELTGEGIQCEVKQYMHVKHANVLLDEVPPMITHNVVCLLSPMQRGLYDELILSQQERGVLPAKKFLDTTSRAQMITNHTDLVADWLRQRGVAEPNLSTAELNKRLRRGTGGAKAVRWALPALTVPSVLFEQGESDESTIPTSIQSLDFNWKMRALILLLNWALSNGEKVIVFSQSVKTLFLIGRLLHAAGLMDGEDFGLLDGRIPSHVRDDVMQRFNCETSAMAVLLLSFRSCSVGCNLIGANRVILFEPSWRSTLELQAIFRAFRYGQTKSVYVNRLLVDTPLERLMKKKANVQKSEDLISMATCDLLMEGKRNGPPEYVGNVDIASCDDPAVVFLLQRESNILYSVNKEEMF